jgi:hypothetical protein
MLQDKHQQVFQPFTGFDMPLAKITTAPGIRLDAPEKAVQEFARRCPERLGQPYDCSPESSKTADKA